MVFKVTESGYDIALYCAHLAEYSSTQSRLITGAINLKLLVHAQKWTHGTMGDSIHKV